MTSHDWKGKYPPLGSRIKWLGNDHFDYGLFKGKTYVLDGLIKYNGGTFFHPRNVGQKEDGW